jgi:uncharacterized protein (DUF1778 family)
MAQAQAQEPVTISIRAKAGQRDLIDQAADRLGRSRSDFMLEAACRQAEDVLLDQTYFALDARSFVRVPGHARQAARRPPTACAVPSRPVRPGNGDGQGRFHGPCKASTRQPSTRQRVK